MRILIHDFAGHPFPLPLSRALARRGHRVLHVYCGELVGPRGKLVRGKDDPPGFEIAAVTPPRGMDKRALVRRRFQELAYARALLRAVSDFDPQAVLSGNAPLDVQARLLGRCRRRNARFVFWLQDLIGIGAQKVLARRFGAPGRWAGAVLRRMEGRALRGADAVVAITDDFRPCLDDYGVDRRRVHVIENWAPLAEVPLRPADNAWAREHGLVDKDVLLYSGTLGLKHDPGRLIELARGLESHPRARVVVVSEGTGADRLAAELRREPRANLMLMGFQPFHAVPDMLGSARVVLAILEPDAGVFSVPSKVLTGLCGGKPLLLSVPPENLAARIVETRQAGLVVDPTRPEALCAAAARLLDDAPLRERLGANARRYAEEAFDIERIATRFEELLLGAA
jgi:glycosyltransferase involved in cell wall biosynthesis